MRKSVRNLSSIVSTTTEIYFPEETCADVIKMSDFNLSVVYIWFISEDRWCI